MASVKMPTAAELAKVGSELGMNLSDSDIAFFQETFAGNVAAYALLESLPDNLPVVKYPRTPGYRPEGEENKYNLWYYKSEIKGAAEGKLKGKRVALKDNVCVAAIVTGEADMAIGGDQGGSIRMPSSYCGIVGLKPTWGLVPYTGIMPIELTLDHTGPMTGTVADNALMLEAIAGPDGLDPRQMGCTVDAYTKALGGSASGLKIGVVKEGFGHPQSEKVVDELVKKAAAKFKELGAVVEEVSIPWHLTGMAVWSAIAVEGATWQMMLGNGYGFNWKGLYVTSLVDAHSAWRERADELSDSLKTTILFGKYALNKYRGHYYAKAQNLARKLGAAYDTALAKYDLLLMPTLPLRATKLPDPAGPRMDIINRAFEMLPNTAPFDVTGHPAITLPCGMSEGLLDFARGRLRSAWSLPRAKSRGAPVETTESPYAIALPDEGGPNRCGSSRCCSWLSSRCATWASWSWKCSTGTSRSAGRFLTRRRNSPRRRRCWPPTRASITASLPRACCGDFSAAGATSRSSSSAASSWPASMADSPPRCRSSTSRACPRWPPCWPCCRRDRRARGAGCRGSSQADRGA